MKTYENMTAPAAAADLGADPASGLSAAEVSRRREQYGPNALAAKKGVSPVVRFLQQFNDPLIYILFAAAVVSILLHEVTDSIIILVVVLLNAVIGYIQEARAEKAIEALKKMTIPRALVRRDGEVKEIETSAIVPGDIVVLEAGRQVPADLRLTDSSNLKVEESALTGESQPVDKDCTFVTQGKVPLGDRVNMAYMSTIVTYGRGEGVVTATGMQTEIGRIAKILEQSDTESTPLQKRLADLGRVLGILTIVICVLLFVVALIQRRPLFDMLLTAISLSVAAIPEGLPAVVTIVLAAGVSRMAKNRSIVRRLPAVETLGAVNIICTDKTGTLTQNRMTVTECRVGAELTEPGRAPEELAARFFEGFALCNDASVEGEKKVGDPTETALLDICAANGFHRPELERSHPRVDELPFDSKRKMMTTVHTYGAGRVSYTKGALDSILRHMTAVAGPDGVRPATEEDARRITACASDMARQALRVLALAYRPEADGAREEGLVFLGLAGMIDPPRPEAKQAVDDCRRAGITTVMITGDHRDTALAIAKDLGIASDEAEAASGSDVDAMSEEELRQAVKRLRVFARVSPENKVDIVKAFRADGNIVSMTGDGVNDAPSLKAADIGVAMGRTGTDVAKGAADMILTDDNFATIRLAVESGRNIYNNIRKSVIYLLSSNFGEIIAMFLAVLLDWPVPLTAVMILWINLVTDSLPALALGVDPGNPAVMKEKPRDPSASLFANGGVFNMLLYGAVIGAVTLVGFESGLRQGGLVEGRTMAMAVLGSAELFHAVGMRDVNRSIFRMNHLENRSMLGALAFGFLLQVGIVELPAANRVFQTFHMDLAQWAYALLLALAPLLVHELRLLVLALLRRARRSAR